MEIIYSIGSVVAGPGIGNVAYNAAYNANTHGYLKELICWAYEGKKIEEDRIARVLAFGELFNKIPNIYIKDAFYDMLASLHVSKCDIFHGWNNHSLSSMKKAKKLGAKAVIERASSHPLTSFKLLKEEYEIFDIKDKPISDRVTNRCAKEIDECDFVLVPSRFAYNSFLENEFDENRLEMIPFGVDTKKFRVMRKKDDIFRVLFIGQVCLRKGIQYLLKAFSNLNLKNSELVVKGRILGDVRNIVSNYKANNIHFFGWIEDLVKLYANSSVFVLPSIEEGSALVTYEAMACGRPVIASENTGSVARDGKDGFIVPIRNAKALMEKIQYFYDNEDEIKKMGMNARKQAEKYSWGTYGARLINFYKKCLE